MTFIIYLLGFGVLLSMLFYVYSVRIAKNRPGAIHNRTRKQGRDMWSATLLDCDYEPAKARFGPAKIIPADRVLYHAQHKEQFSHHMESK
jgi:hypothetical protein